MFLEDDYQEYDLDDYAPEKADDEDNEDVKDDATVKEDEEEPAEEEAWGN